MRVKRRKSSTVKLTQACCAWSMAALLRLDEQRPMRTALAASEYLMSWEMMRSGFRDFEQCRGLTLTSLHRYHVDVRVKLVESEMSKMRSS